MDGADVLDRRPEAPDGTRTRVDPASPPSAFRAFAIFSLLWNLLGAADYVMSVARLPVWLAHMPADAAARLAALPAWMVALWATGVWGAVAGSLLLLARRRAAEAGFALAFAATLAMHAARAADGREMAPGAALLVLGLLAWQWGYTRRAGRKGWIA